MIEIIDQSCQQIYMAHVIIFILITATLFLSLINRIHEAKITGSPEVYIWGSGKPKREFLHVTDMADASIFVMNSKDS